MGPPGCKIFIHEKSWKFGSWEFHGVPGFYIGIFVNGNCTYKVYIPKMKSEESADKVVFLQSTKIPFTSITDAITKVVTDIYIYFMAKTAQASPIKEIGYGKRSSLQQIINIFSEMKETEWCKTVLYPRVKKSRPEISTRSLSLFNPIISTLPSPQKKPQSKPINIIRKRKEIKDIPKQDKNVHPNTSNPPRVKTRGDPRVTTEITAPNEKNDANSPENSTPSMRVEPTTSTISMTPKKRPTLGIVSPDTTSIQHSKCKSLT